MSKKNAESSSIYPVKVRYATVDKAGEPQPSGVLKTADVFTYIGIHGLIGLALGIGAALTLKNSESIPVLQTFLVQNSLMALKSPDTLSAITHITATAGVVLSGIRGIRSVTKF